MKKHLLAILLLLASSLCAPLLAQTPSQLYRQQEQQMRMHQMQLQQQLQMQQMQRMLNSTNPTPWDGHTIISLHTGIGIVEKPSFGYLDVSNLQSTPAFLLGFRYAGERYFANRLFYGWHTELSYQRHALDFRLDGDQTTLLHTDSITAGHWVDCHQRHWSIAFEERLSIGYDISTAFSLTLSAGLALGVHSHNQTESTLVHKTTGATLGNKALFSSKNEILTWGLIGSAQLELFYYLSSNLVLSCAAKAHFGRPTREFTQSDFPNAFALLFGIGYKSYVKRNLLTDD